MGDRLFMLNKMSVFVSLNCSEIRQSVPSAIPLSKGSFDDGPRDCVCWASKMCNKGLLMDETAHERNYKYRKPNINVVLS